MRLSSTQLSSSQIEQFRQAIMSWQRSHGRHDLPWQQNTSAADLHTDGVQTTSPKNLQIKAYQVHVSEIMLQQTQVATVIPYFQRWMSRFPTLHTLAKATEDEVMALWQGLGYYSRARNLRRAAQHLIDVHGGEYPNELPALNAIPGVGRYTAGAIRSFAFNTFGPIVDGNVKRLYARLFAVDGEPDSTAFNRSLWQFAEQLTPEVDSRVYSQGVLDLGALICKKSSPECDNCPLQLACRAHQIDRIARYPNPKTRRALPTKQAHFLWHADDDRVILEKRASPGIWGGLWCFPEVQTPPEGGQELGKFNHQFSHYRLEATVWLSPTTCFSTTASQDNAFRDLADRVRESAHALVTADTFQAKLKYKESNAPERRAVSTSKLANTGLPTPIRQFIEDICALGKLKTL